MVTAHVLVRVEPGLDKDVVKNVKKMPQVKEVVTVYGEYDLIIKIEVEDLMDLDTFIFDRIRTIGGIESTTTLISTKISSKK